MSDHRDLKKYCYFSSLSEGALEAISRKLHIVEYPSGSEIIKEGAPADAFYLVRTGEVDILQKSKWGQTSTISVVGRGEGFGEMALLTCSPRYCTVGARTDVTLLRLLKADFDDIVNSDSTFSGMVEHRVRNYLQFNRMKTLQPFALLTPEKMSALTSKLSEKKYSEGGNIITQGEKGDLYYVIKSGRVKVLKQMFGGEFEQVASLEEGEGFGEEALITDNPRNATVIADKNTIVWALSRPDFDAIMKSSFHKEVTTEDVLSGKSEINYLDVRMDVEYDEEHITGAIHIPLDELRKKYANLDQKKEYAVYCLSGLRSASAAFLLNSQGFKAASIKGGLQNWPGPVEKGNDGVHTPFTPT